MSTIMQPSLSLPITMPVHNPSERLLAGHAGHGVGHGNDANNRSKSPQAVAKGFEEIFASTLVKSMRHTIGGGGMFGHDPGDVLGGMFDHFLSQHIAHAGRLGIGKMIQKHLEHRSPKP